MNILFLMLAFPDLEKSSNLYSELVLEFADRGHTVFPVAPLAGEGKTHISREKGIDVLRVKTMKLFNVDPLRKGIANVLLPYQFQHAIDKYFRDIHFDVIVMPTPPITLGRVAGEMKKRTGAKVYLILRDIFPQNALDLGMMSRRNPMYRIFRRQEKYLYRIADTIGCMSAGNIRYVREHNPEVPEAKLHILENFQRPVDISERKDGIKEKYGVEGKFVIIFGGNMGIPQKLENVIDLAKECEEYEDVVFLLVGKGTQRGKIEALIKEKKSKNILLKEYIPHQDYQQLVALCDIGLISLNECFTIPNIPSKTLSYFNLGIPVLASVDKCTDYGEILDRAGAGLWSVAGDLKSYKANFDRLYRDKALRETMGRNGKKYFEEHLTLDVAYNVIMEHV